MGYYTEANFKIHLKSNVPEKLIATLNRIIVDGDIGGGDGIFVDKTLVWKPPFEHGFFNCSRWYMFFRSTNWGSHTPSKFYKSGNHWIIEIDSEFKNYEDEIEHFVNFITPYVGGSKLKKFIGYSKGEAIEDPQINYYVNCQK